MNQRKARRLGRRNRDLRCAVPVTRRAVAKTPQGDRLIGIEFRGTEGPTVLVHRGIGFRRSYYPQIVEMNRTQAEKVRPYNEQMLVERAEAEARRREARAAALAVEQARWHERIW